MDERAGRQTSAEVSGLRVLVRGTVQGVGMRPFVYRLARAEGLAGSVRNDGRGVRIEVFGADEALARFLGRLRSEKPGAAGVDELTVETIAPAPGRGFAIVESQAATAGAERRISIPADLAACDACLAEVRDPSSRRHRYPFTNCTACGPRFTITRDVPYDRARTTMAPFAMCGECRREYEDPGDRRFHAEPNACPRCGPALTLLSPQGGALAAGDAALRAAGRALAEGRIVALKGIGGFHLACDARSSPAVRALRERKRRTEKPLAVMVRDAGEAAALCELGAAERALLTGPERPIVLAAAREGGGLAPEIAPDTKLLGVLLPYSPLHHLLLAEAGRPLVMTSGNVSEEPIAYRDEEARRRLAGIADLLLVHDREIEARADDSVARVVGGRPVLVRRSRGHAPRGVAFPRRFARPVLACGGHLKNVFCLGVGDAATPGAHVGDLDTPETLASYEQAIARLEAFLRVRPELIAHDLHPAYASTRYAIERARAEELPAVAVQHHHAHVAACMADAGLDGEVLGLAWDGMGYGTDGTAWGGELLLATYQGYERVATFRALPLAGGERAIREPWRVALAALDDAFPEGPPDGLAFVRALPAEARVVRQMIRRGLNAPLAHGAGRLFDAIAALALGRSVARYEGQLALALEAAADPGEPGRYPFDVDTTTTPWELDWRPVVRGAAEDLAAGRSGGVVAARFHRTLAAAGAELLRLAAARRGGRPIVLSGGCFQNALLVEGMLRELGPAPVHLHRAVPPGDGGIALGQAAVADAQRALS